LKLKALKKFESTIKILKIHILLCLKVAAGFFIIRRCWSSTSTDHHISYL